MTPDTRYMRRAIQLARNGYPGAFPNPMVGAVIVDESGRVTGEGYHRRCGEAHAEVNAIASVANPETLRRSTIYVTLEPCAHQGRTGPCARLIMEKGIPEVVVGCRDPFDKVDGKGIEMMREAGIKVHVGMLEEECRKLNPVFFTAHTLRRPFVMLKWAQSADGYLDRTRADGEGAYKFSSPLTSALTHRWRGACDGILTGAGTVLADDPMLDTRLWPGKSPRPIILDRRGRVDGSYRVGKRDPLIIKDDKPLAEILGDLYEKGFTSIMVEGGGEILRSFTDTGLWDLARVESIPLTFGACGTAKAPGTGNLAPLRTIAAGDNTITYYSRNPLIDVKNL